MDDADVSVSIDQAVIAKSRAIISERARAQRPPQAHCLYCEEALSPERQPAGTCDKDCMDAWEHEQRRLRDLGRVVR